MFGEQRYRQDRAGKAPLHVRDAAAVEASVLQRSTERRHRPTGFIADREGIEMAVENETPARGLGAEARDQADNAGLRLDDPNLEAGDTDQQLLRGLGDRHRIARRIGRGHPHQRLGHGDQPRHVPLDLTAEELAHALSFTDWQGGAPRAGSPSPAASR